MSLFDNYFREQFFIFHNKKNKKNMFDNKKLTKYLKKIFFDNIF